MTTLFSSDMFIFSLEDTYKGENNITNYYLAFLGIGPSSNERRVMGCLLPGLPKLSSKVFLVNQVNRYVCL